MSGLLTKMPLSYVPIRRVRQEVTPEDRKAVFEAFNFDEKIMRMFDLAEKEKVDNKIFLRIDNDEWSLDLNEKTINCITYSCF